VGLIIGCVEGEMVVGDLVGERAGWKVGLKDGGRGDGATGDERLNCCLEIISQY
jgi:hypothetical protein